MKEPAPTILTWTRGHALFMLLGLGLTLTLKAATWAAGPGLISFALYFYFRQTDWRNGWYLGGPANWATSLRILGIGVLAPLLPYLDNPVLAALALLFLSLDGIDGYLARRLGTTSLFGEYLDKEGDAFFVAMLCTFLYVKGLAGAWVLSLGAIRYLYIWLLYGVQPPQQKETRSRTGRVLAACIMTGLVLCLGLPEGYAYPLLLAVATLTFFSFGRSLYRILLQSPALHRVKDFGKRFPSLTRESQTWGSFLLLNSLLFLPAWVVNRQRSTFLPSSDLAPLEDLGAWSFWLIRDNFDVFRLSGEGILLLGLAMLIRPPQKIRLPIRFLLTGVWLLLVYFQIYYSISMKLYSLPPNLTDDWRMAWTNLPAFLGQMFQGATQQYFLGIWLFLLGSVALTFAISALLRFLLCQPLRWGRVFLLGCLLAVAWDAHRILDPTFYRKDYHAFQWLALHVKAALKAPDTDRIKQPPRLALYQEMINRDLHTKPDIYLIFIESYGKNLLRFEELRKAYTDILTEENSLLEASGFFSTSAFCRSPISGGKSWLAFTSFMAGIRLDSQSQYDTLIHHHPDFPHMVRYFTYQGYDTYHLKSMANHTGGFLAGEAAADSFFSFIYPIRHPDFPYKGYEYDWFGGVPDQYVMNHFQEHLVRSATRPLFMFFITMASHTPWFPPPKIMDDWHLLDTLRRDPYQFPLPDPEMHPYDQFLQRFNQRLERDDVSKRHAESIFYDLKVSFQFIRQQIRRNSLIILIGDHQPPLITDVTRDGMETPVHVISQDSTLIHLFDDHGFQRGLIPDTTKSSRLTHESMYTRLMSILMARYSDNGRKVVVLPEGL